MRVESVEEAEEVVDFLSEHLPQGETILSALRVKPSDELRLLLRDVVEDCVGKGSSSRLARDQDGSIEGVCLATANCVLDKQLDRLYTYTFQDENLRIANAFAQTVFNRVDIPFHVEEANMRRPLFIALICVRSDRCGRGIGRTLLQASVGSGKEQGCDGAFALASNNKANRLFAHELRNAPQGVAYDSWKGEYRDPPIVPLDPHQTKIFLRIGHF